jgi:hypothetical protein
MKELVELLTKRLNVSPAQARGGAAVLFKAAQYKLGTARFESLLGGVPGVDELLRQVPSAGGASRVLGGLAGALGGGNAAAIASIVSGFTRLGLTAEHAKQFAPVIMEFLHGKVGKDAVDTLEKSLRG